MKQKEFCEKCFDNLESNIKILDDYWPIIGETILSKHESNYVVDLIFQISHGKIHKMFNGRLSPYYPTPKKYIDAVKNQNRNWFVLHATGGVSIKPVLTWFSGLAREDRDGAIRLRGGSSHFVVEHDGTPWVLIPLTDGAWHCYQRNRDSIAIELINTTWLDYRNGKYYWWNGLYKLPYKPIKISKKFRGKRYFQPYDERQIITTFKLMRLVISAIGKEKFSIERVTSHTDWSKKKFDPGPLFPFDILTKDVFGFEKMSNIEWIQAFQDQNNQSFDTDTTVDKDELKQLFDIQTCSETQDEFDHSYRPVDFNYKIQKQLVKLGLLNSRHINGIFGSATKQAVRNFQISWNVRNKKDQIKVDGIPGPQTMSRIFVYKHNLMHTQIQQIRGI